MSFPYKIVAFDLDGTLTESKQPITRDMSDLLEKLSKVTKVVVISGGSFARFEDQILRSLKPSANIILLPAEGSLRYEYADGAWKMTERQVFPEDLKKEAMKVLEEIIASPEFEIPPHPQGAYIDDRDTEIAFSALGQDAPLAEKEKWDPTRARRFKIKKAIEERLPNVMAAVAGTTSIDILPLGFDKARGLGLLLSKMNIQKDEVLFVGDAIVPGGNDYPVFEAGVKSMAVRGPAETALIIRNLVEEPVAPPPVHPAPSFPENPIVYFCSEYALDVNPDMYAGGLGILAGDYVLEAGDQNLPFIAIGVHYGMKAPSEFGILENITVEVPIGKDTVKAKVWHRAFSERTHVLLLDTNVPENTDEQKRITEHLYDNDFFVRIHQQMVLGIGGVRLLVALDIVPRRYHLNEGHTSFAAVALAVEKKDELEKVVSTKHTILSAAGLLIPFSDMENLIGPYCKKFKANFKKLCEKGHYELSPDLFSTTKFVLASAVRKNAVSAIHAVFEKKVHPHSTLISVTNGVYRKRWQAREFLKRSPDFSSTNLLEVKKRLRLELFEYIHNVSGKNLNPDICTLVWARRFASYKRPYLLFSDIEKLTHLVTHSERPLNIVISGKAHPADKQGASVVQKIVDFSDTSAVKGKVVYLPDYSILSARYLTRGADIWLNTPELGKEACGTSGMKACLNGALQVSVRDGWVDEVSLEGIGWALPGDKEALETAEVLYDLLEHEILPCFYEENSTAWTMRMRSTIELVEKSYTSARMAEDYEKKLYTW